MLGLLLMTTRERPGGGEEGREREDVAGEPEFPLTGCEGKSQWDRLSRRWPADGPRPWGHDASEGDSFFVTLLDSTCPHTAG